MAATLPLDWFEKLEAILHAEAELAGLLAHGTLIGDAREFFVNRVLRSVLPPATHFGTGRVISSDGKSSKQIDIIVYDARYPVLEAIPGQGHYLAEGVIAAVEVKSDFNKERIVEALDNLHSVASLARCATYAFGFSGVQAETFANHVRDWWNATENEHAIQARLPNVIVSGSVAGISNRGADALFAVSHDGKHFDPRLMMGFWPIEKPFGLLLIHLAIAVLSRNLAGVPFAFPIDTLQAYMPIDEFAEKMRQAPCQRIWWNE